MRRLLPRTLIELILLLQIKKKAFNIEEQLDNYNCCSFGFYETTAFITSPTPPIKVLASK